MTPSGCPAETSEELVLSPCINEIFETRISVSSAVSCPFLSPSHSSAFGPRQTLLQEQVVPAFHAEVEQSWELHCWALAHSCLAATGKTLPLSASSSAPEQGP